MPTYYFCYHVQTTEGQHGCGNSYITVDKLNKESIEKAKKDITSHSPVPLHSLTILSINKLDD